MSDRKQAAAVEDEEDPVDKTDSPVHNGGLTEDAHDDEEEHENEAEEVSEDSKHALSGFEEILRVRRHAIAARAGWGGQTGADTPPCIRARAPASALRLGPASTIGARLTFGARLELQSHMGGKVPFLAQTLVDKFSE